MSGWFSSTFASALDSVYNAIDPDFAKYEGSQDGKGGDKQQQQEATRGVEEEGKVEEDNNQPPQPSSAINTATPSTATTIGTSNATIIATRQDDTSDTHRVVVAGVSELAESGLKLIDKTFDFASNFLGNSLVTG